MKSPVSSSISIEWSIAFIICCNIALCTLQKSVQKNHGRLRTPPVLYKSCGTYLYQKLTARPASDRTEVGPRGILSPLHANTNALRPRDVTWCHQYGGT